MWTEKWRSSGDDEMVNGCHSVVEIDGQCRNKYWPLLYRNFCLVCLWSLSASTSFVGEVASISSTGSLTPKFRALGWS